MPPSDCGSNYSCQPHYIEGTGVLIAEFYFLLTRLSGAESILDFLGERTKTKKSVSENGSLKRNMALSRENLTNIGLPFKGNALFAERKCNFLRRPEDRGLMWLQWIIRTKRGSSEDFCVMPATKGLVFWLSGICGGNDRSMILCGIQE